MKKTKILHIAPFNTAGVPITFVKAERELGFDSRLITFVKHPNNYEEDICLNLPFLNFNGLLAIKKFFSDKSKLKVTNTTPKLDSIPLKWYPKNNIEKNLIQLREIFWTKKISKTIKKYRIIDYDIIQLDGGLGFYRNGNFVRALKKLGKKIICCYTGSDLRVRGVIPEIDAISDLNITVEFDHLNLHPNISHVFFPFNWKNFKIQSPTISKTIKIGHAPTNRQAKGSDIIITILHEIKEQYPIEIILIENYSYNKALEIKSQCNIFIDQIGDLGYGINSLESLAMGIPTCSCLAPGFAQKYPTHPFIDISANNLKHKIIDLIKQPALLEKKREICRSWVKQNHDSIAIVKKIHELGKIT